MHIGPNIVEDGLVLYLDAANKKSYPGTGTTWYDLSGKGNNGILVNNPIYDTNNFIFDGRETQTTLSELLLDSNFTISIFFQNTGSLSTEDRRTLLQLSGSFSNIELSSTNVLSINNIETTSSFFNVGTLESNKYYDISLTRDSSDNVRVYVNGVLTDNDIIYLPNSIKIDGVGAAQTIRTFSGNIAAISVYNKTLSARQLLQNYNAISARYGRNISAVRSRLQSDVDKFKVLVRNNNHAFEAEGQLLNILEDLEVQNLYESASMVLTANGYGENVVYCIKPLGYTGSFSRNSTAFRTNQNGIIEEVPYNLLGNSDRLNLNSSYWGPLNALAILTSSYYDQLSPDGRITATTYEKQTGSGLRGAGSYFQYVDDNTTQYCFSVHAKTANTASFSMDFADINIKSFDIDNVWGRYDTNGVLTGQWNVTRLVNFDINLPTAIPVTLWGAQMNLGSTPKPYFSTTDRLNVPAIEYINGVAAIRAIHYAENYLRYSEDFTQNVWVSSSLEVTSNTVEAPNGVVSGDTLTALSSNATIKQTQNMSNRICLFAVYLKRKTGTGNVNIKAGNVSSSIDLTNEWQRFVVDGPRYSTTYTASNGNYEVTTTNYPHGLQPQDWIRFNPGTSSAGFNIKVNSIIDDYTFTFTRLTTTETGTGNIQPHTVEIEIETQGDEIYAWGAQASGTGYFQTDLSQTRYDTRSYAKDYVFTTTGYQNRGSEDLILDNLYSQNITPSGSGCLYFEMANLHTMNTFYTGIYVMDIKNELDELIFSLENNTSISDYWRLRYGSSRTLITGANTVSLLEFHKICIKYTSTTVDFFFDGSKVSTYSIPQPAPNLNIDSISIVGYQAYKHISVFPLLTDTQCETLTTI